MKGIVFHPEAKADLIGAIAYYDGQREGLGDKFLEEVDKVTDRISQLPKSFHSSNDQGHRKSLLGKFPLPLVIIAK